MLELILVRHGETDSNLRQTYCGWTDAGLTQNGRKQARAAARKLNGTSFEAVYTSPLKRAYSTAYTICGNSVSDIICTDNLKEQNFGDWEDLTYAEILDKYPDECTEWKSDWANYCIRGGESPFQVYSRVSGFIDELVDRHKNGKVLLVTHLGCIRFILAHLLGMSIDGFWRFKADNGSISRIMVTDDKYAYLTALNT